MIRLKLECALPTGSYKIRGVTSFFRDRENRKLKELSVLSAGNLAIAAAHECRKYGIRCRALVPEGISDAKKRGLLALGAELEELPFSMIWNLVESREKRLEPGFLHPFHPRLLQGYSTIADELVLEARDDAAAVVLPYGLGGLALSVVQGLERLGSEIRVHVCEIEGHAPFSRARDAGVPVPAERLKSFIGVMGTPTVIPDVFERLRDKVSVVQVTEQETRNALSHLSEKMNLHVEGAAAAAYAGALKLGNGEVIALLTGRNA